MVDHYNNFAVFMAEAVKNTKQRIVGQSFSGKVWVLVGDILTGVGWKGFVIVCGFLALGSIAFGFALVPFFVTPVGLFIVAIGGGAVMWTLWRNKKLPLAVKKVGDKYKAKFEEAYGDNAQIDRLLKDVENALFQELIGE